MTGWFCSPPQTRRTGRRGLREKKTNPRLLKWLGMAGVLLWIALPLVLFGVLAVRTATTSVEPQRPAYVNVETATASTTRPIALGLRWDGGETLVAPSWTGVVQEVSVRDGDEITDGSAVVRIDGIVRRAAQTPLPFGRPLSTEDTGEDVRMLNDYLRVHGYAATDGDRFGWDTRIGVQAFAKDIGVLGADSVGSFDPSWVVFLPDGGVVQKVEFTVGAPAPAPGAEVVTLRSSLVDAVLLENAPPENDPPDKDGARSEPVEPTTTAAANEVLVVNGETIGLAEDRQRVKPDYLGDLASMVADGSPSLVAVLRTDAAPGEWVVPVPGVIIDPSGATCVKVRSNDGVRSVPVSIVGTTDGRMVVSGDLEPADSIAVYPTSVSITCT